MVPKPYVSVIIPVFDDLERLKICLQSLMDQTYNNARYEIIVVDNYSHENISEGITSFKNVKLIREEKQSSYAARNKGISSARGDIIALTDSDCIPNNDWIEKGVNNILRNPCCGLIAGHIDLFCRNPLKPTIIEVFELFTEFNQKQYIEKQHFGATANLFIVKSIFEKVGYFNPNLLSGGDVEWGNRVFACGYKLIYAADTRINHPARRTFRERYKKLIRVIKGEHESGRIDYSFKEFIKNIMSPVVFIKDILFKKKKYKEYRKKIKTKKQTYKIIVAFIFELIIWNFGRIIVKYSTDKKNK